jgi:hypothetical protein
MRKAVSWGMFFLVFSLLGSTGILARQGGDVNSDGKVNVADVVFLVHYLYRGGPPPAPLTYSDFDSDFDVDESDILCAVDYLYRKGDPPATPLELLEISVTSPHNADGVDSSEVTITRLTHWGIR